MDCCTPGFPLLHQLPEFAQIRVHWVSDAMQPSQPLSSPSPPALSLSQHQGLFQWVSFCIRWPKYWSFSFSISPSNEYSGLISFRGDWFDLLAVQGTLKSLLQYHSSKASVLQSSAFFIVQCSHPHMTSGKNINMLPHGPKWMLQFQPVCSHMNILSRKKGNIFFFFSSIRTGSHGPFN